MLSSSVEDGVEPGVPCGISAGDPSELVVSGDTSNGSCGAARGVGLECLRDGLLESLRCLFCALVVVASGVLSSVC